MEDLMRNHGTGRAIKPLTLALKTLIHCDIKIKSTPAYPFKKTKIHNFLKSTWSSHLTTFKLEASTTLIGINMVRKEIFVCSHENKF